MTYTPEELQEGAHALIHAPLEEAPYDIDELSGLLSYPNLETFAALVLDAVLPGYTQRIQAQLLTYESRGFQMAHDHDPDHKVSFAEVSRLLAVRAAALAAPVEPTPLLTPTPEQRETHRKYAATVDVTAPPVEQPVCEIKGPYYPVGDLDLECRTHGATAVLVDPSRYGAKDLRRSDFRCSVGSPPVEQPPTGPKVGYPLTGDTTHPKHPPKGPAAGAT